MTENMKYSRGNHYLRQWREYRGLSLRALASRLEVSPGGPLIADYAALSRIETGETRFNEDVLNAVAEALDVDRTDLLSKDPNKDGQVIDLLRRLDDRDRQRIIEMMEVMANSA